VTAVTAFAGPKRHYGGILSRKRGPAKRKETAMYQIRKTVLGLVALAALSSYATQGWAGAPSEAEKRAACTGDVMQFCYSMIPDMGRIEGCLRANRARLSPSCKGLFNKYEGK
jgi:hypothetical protein